jgi:hypothetical protein
LADCQFLDEIDNRYWFYTQGDKQGRPMQFRLKPEYCIEWDLFVDSGEEERVSIREAYPAFIPFNWRPEQVPAPEFDYLAWDEALVMQAVNACR